MRLELGIMAGKESKEFLSELSTLLDRMEKVAAKLSGKKQTASSEELNAEESEEDEDFAPKKASKKAKPSFEEDEEEEAPKSSKQKKLTIDDVNDACMKRSGRTNRAEVLGILKTKFKVKSVTDLEPEQYAAVVKAMSGKA